MNELTDSFGQLSTSAKEWRPSSSSSKYPSSFGNYTGGASIRPDPLHQSYHRASGLQRTSPGKTVWQQQQQQQQQQPPPPRQPHEQTEWYNGAQEPERYGNPGSISNPSPWGCPQAQHITSPVWAERTHMSSNQLDELPEDHQDWHPRMAASIPAGPPPPPPIRSLHELPDDLWNYFREVALESQCTMDVSDPQNKAIPPAWTSALSLDGTNTKTIRSSFGYPITTFKVVSREDGHLYCLRRVDNVRCVSHKIANSVSEKWTVAVYGNGARVIDHGGLVRFHQCFLANRAVFFLHQYCPGAQTLRERFFGGANPIALPEPIVWSCVTQLVAAVRAVHGGGLACRTLQLNHILCHGSGRLRLRINCLGIVDALEFEARKPTLDLQVEDMRDFGRVILSLSTGTEVTRASDDNTYRRCDLFVAQTCSPEMHNLIVQLLHPSKAPPSIFEVRNVITSHILDELDLQQSSLDHMEASLSAEYDSSRALRLLLKLGFVNERPELGVNRRWSESGDCYVLKLFRDYVFHQANESGNPVMDLGHVVSCLNKLDAGIEDEQIVLTSRDGKTLMVVSYGDVARSLENAYGELCLAAAPVPPVPPSMPHY